jgi:hypothetical protein
MSPSKQVGISARPKPLPTHFSCVDPEQAKILFAYVDNKNGTANKEAATAHLGLCLYCQEKLARKRLDLALLKEFGIR